LSDGTGTFQVGPGTGASQQISAPSLDLTATSIGSGGSLSTAAGAASALNTVSSALDNVSAVRAQIGALSNRFDSAAGLNSNAEINTTDAQSRMEDLDYAQALMDLSRVDILSQSSISAAQHFSQISKNTVIGLLQ